MTGRGAAVILTSALVTAACSDGRRAVTTSTIEPVEQITAPPVTQPDATPAQTEPSPTDPTTTTAPAASTTVLPTTTPAPPTTTLEDLRREIEDDLNEGEQAFLEGAATPGDPESIARLDRYFAGDSLATVRSFYDRLMIDGLMAQPNETVPSRHSVFEVLARTGNAATVKKCRIDAAVITRIVDGEVIDEEIVRYISTSEVLLQDGTWKLNGGATESRETGQPTCA